MGIDKHYHIVYISKSDFRKKYFDFLRFVTFAQFTRGCVVYYYKGKGRARVMVRMVIFYAEKSNHRGALIFSVLLCMVVMVINVYIILIYIIIVYIFIYTYGIVKVIRSFL